MREQWDGAARLAASGAVVVLSAFGGVTAVGVGTCSGVLHPAGAHTPGFSTVCDVPEIGTVDFPTIITGSIPASIPDGSDFSVTVPSGW